MRFILVPLQAGEHVFRAGDSFIIAKAEDVEIHVHDMTEEEFANLPAIVEQAIIERRLREAEDRYETRRLDADAKSHRRRP